MLVVDCTVAGKLQARERMISERAQRMLSNGGRPGSAPMSPGIYEPLTPSIRPNVDGNDSDDLGMSVEDFEQRMAEWLEFNRQEKASPGSGIRPLVR